MLSALAWGDAGWGDEMLRAAFMTLAVAVSSFLLGIVLGTLGAAAKLSSLAPLRWLGEVYTVLVRGIPELLIIYLLFFGGSMAVMSLARGLFGYDGYVELNAFTTGTVAIGTISGAYATEVIRGAILSVPVGQIEAARACGMSGPLLAKRIMLPQVTRYALPGLGNVWQNTLKNTALISVTGLVEIMRQSHIAAGSTRQPFLFFTIAAILFLILTSMSNVVFHRLETRAAVGTQR
ncbi:MAG: ABC transporter permease [Geminicoccaceae bacterium]